VELYLHSPIHLHGVVLRAQGQHIFSLNNTLLSYEYMFLLSNVPSSQTKRGYVSVCVCVGNKQVAE
jgi:hypothetical protein